MTANAPNETRSPAAVSWWTRPFVRFVVVGAIGFLVDALVLFLAVHACRLNPLLARFLSFSLAVLVTFELNRRWSFQGRGDPGYWSGLSKYLGVQGLGFAANFVVYSTLYLTLKTTFDSPLFCLAVASVVALAVNYSGANHLVFRAQERG